MGVDGETYVEGVMEVISWKEEEVTTGRGLP